MMHTVISDGEDRLLGCAYFCVRDDRSSPDYCDEVIDCDCTPLQPMTYQLDLFNEATV